MDCTNYSDDSCPKGITIKPDFDLNNLEVAIFGCWGVYCQDGDITIQNYKENDKLATKIPDELKVEDFFEYSKSYRGQQRVIDSLYKKFKSGLNSLFLAGDNIYEYSLVSDDLKIQLQNKIIEWQNWFNENQNSSSEDKIKKFNKIFPTKKDIKKKRELREDYKNLRIDLQFNSSFGECLRKVDIENIFLALGNHDIETCNILNTQLNYLKDETHLLPATYYNVVYGDILNVIIIDTNLFEEEPTDCNGNEYLPEDIQNQIKWFETTLENSKCKYNIVIGHIPYKAIGHKRKEVGYIHNKKLEPIFDIIKENKGKVQAYFCADEHNQQLLYDIPTGIYLVVVGSGGTELDKLEFLTEEEYSQLQVENVMYKLSGVYGRKEFGFSYLSYDYDSSNLKLTLTDVDNNSVSLDLSF